MTAIGAMSEAVSDGEDTSLGTLLSDDVFGKLITLSGAFVVRLRLSLYVLIGRRQ